MTDKNIITKFKGPGQWRSQAKKLEAGRPNPTPPPPKK